MRELILQLGDIARRTELGDGALHFEGLGGYLFLGGVCILASALRFRIEGLTVVLLALVQKREADLYSEGSIVALECLVVLVVIVVLAKARVLSNEINRGIKLFVLSTRLEQLRRSQFLRAL